MSFFVRVIGLEPTRLAAPDPKSGTSTNFATPAKHITKLLFKKAFYDYSIVGANIMIIFKSQIINHKNDLKFVVCVLIFLFVYLTYYKLTI